MTHTGRSHLHDDTSRRQGTADVTDTVLRIHRDMVSEVGPKVCQHRPDTTTLTAELHVAFIKQYRQNSYAYLHVVVLNNSINSQAKCNYTPSLTVSTAKLQVIHVVSITASTDELHATKCCLQQQHRQTNYV